MLKLNIGCDTLTLPKPWLNIDLRQVKEDIIALDVRRGLPYSALSVDEIYAGHFFDHLSYYEGLNFLKESYRVLKSGGILRLSLMDTDKLIDDYLIGRMAHYNNIQPEEYKQMVEQSLKFATFLLGNLGKEVEYMGHKMLYTASSIWEVSRKCGFAGAALVKPDFTIEPWSVGNKEHLSHSLYVELKK